MAAQLQVAYSGTFMGMGSQMRMIKNMVDHFTRPKVPVAASQGSGS